LVLSGLLRGGEWEGKGREREREPRGKEGREVDSGGQFDHGC